MEFDREAVRQNLLDAGCGENTIKQFFESAGADGKLQVLRTYRKQLLESYHREAKKIDCLDYLIYAIERCKRNG